MNHGRKYWDYVDQSIPKDKQWKLKAAIADADLLTIAKDFFNWLSRATSLGLSPKDISEIHLVGGPEEKRRKALEIWKAKNGRGATYELLLDKSLLIGDTKTADNICAAINGFTAPHYQREHSWGCPDLKEMDDFQELTSGLLSALVGGGAQASPPLPSYRQAGQDGPQGSPSNSGQVQQQRSWPGDGTTRDNQQASSPPEHRIPLQASVSQGYGASVGTARGNQQASSPPEHRIPLQASVSQGHGASVMSDGGHTQSAPQDQTSPSQCESMASPQLPFNYLNVLTELHSVNVEWRSLGLALHIHESKLTVIETDFPSDVKRRLEAVIDHWFKVGGSSVTWETLCGALRHVLVSRPDVAAEIEKKLIL